MGCHEGLVGLRKIYCGVFIGRARGEEGWWSVQGGLGRSKHGKTERRGVSKGRSSVSKLPVTMLV